MRKLFRRFSADGSASVGAETGLALPVFLLLVFGVFQAASLFWAQASLANAVGQAARYSTIYPRPSDQDIENYARSSELGIDSSRIRSVSVQHGVSSGRNYTEITITYTAPIDFVFFDLPAITLTQQRRAYNV